MRVLVIGRTGQLAQSLAARRPEMVDLVLTGRPEFDLAEPEALADIIAGERPDAIVNAAAYTAVDKAEVERARAMVENADAPGAMARLAAGVGLPFVHISTDYVFDGSGDIAWTEADPVDPVNYYGRSKLDGERAVAAAGGDHLIIRTAWVYSPFGHNFVRTMLRLAGKLEALNVVEDQFGNPTSALDLADGIYRALEVRQQSGRFPVPLAHLAGSGSTSWADFAREIFARSAARGGPSATVNGIPTSGYPTPAKRPANSRLDSTLFAEAFGYRAPEWRVSLAAVIDALPPEQAD